MNQSIRDVKWVIPGYLGESLLFCLRDSICQISGRLKFHHALLCRKTLRVCVCVCFEVEFKWWLFFLYSFPLSLEGRSYSFTSTVLQ